MAKSDEIKLSGFPKGIDNISREENLPKGSLRAAENIDLDDDGKASRRQGYGFVLGIPNAHSLYSHYSYPYMMVAQNNAMRCFDSTIREVSSTTLTAPGRLLSHDVAAGKLHWSNGVDMGCLDDEGMPCDWVIDQPGGNPSMQAVTGFGGLPKGTYQVTVTFVHEDGRESGAAMAELIDLNEGQGISLTDFPQPASANIVSTRIYRTEQNGDILYLAMEIPVALDTFLLGAQVLGRALETQFLHPMPAGDIVRYHNGRMLVAKGKYLFWSETFNFGLCRITENYIKFNDDITLMEPVSHSADSTMFVAAGKRTYAVIGASPKDWTRKVVAPYGATPGASCIVDAKSIGDGQGGRLETTGEVPVWMSSDGCLVAGLPGGLMVRLIDRNYVANNDIEHGSMAIRDINGISQIVSTLRGGSTSRLRVVDSVEAEVWKDGKRIR